MLTAVTEIRPYRPGDRAGLGNVCIRTAAAGEDATGDYVDPSILPEIFAAPYAVLEPDLAFVVEDDGEVVGYVLGTADTPTFVRRFREEWLPVVGASHPPPTGEPASPDELMAYLLHHPERMLVPEVVAWPAHVHIDLLPPYQRRGLGRGLMETFVAALRKAGVPVLHLSMLSANVRARAFHDRLGFEVLEVPGTGELTYLGLRVAARRAETTDRFMETVHRTANQLSVVHVDREAWR